MRIVLRKKSYDCERETQILILKYISSNDVRSYDFFMFKIDYCPFTAYKNVNRAHKNRY